MKKRMLEHQQAYDALKGKSLEEVQTIRAREPAQWTAIAKACDELIVEKSAERRVEGEKRHRELVDAARRDDKPGGVVKWSWAVVTAILVGLIIAYAKGCFPEVLR